MTTPEREPVYIDDDDLDLHGLAEAGDGRGLAIRDLMGDLLPLYDEHAYVVQDAPPGDVFVEYYPDAQQDRRRKEIDALSVDVTPEEFAEAMERARYKRLSAEEAALGRAGFAGTSARLFAQFGEFDKNGAEISEIDSELISLLSVLKQVPKEQRKGATVSKAGYSFGGLFFRIDGQPDN